MSVPFHTLRREQWIPRPIQEVFSFFADAYNLEQITPPWLNFRILSLNSDTVHEGTLIRYRLRSHGLPKRAFRHCKRTSRSTVRQNLPSPP
jgi:ligand-binding SRPBCC domain-containing protein